MELSRLLNFYPILRELPPRLQHALFDSGYTIRLNAGEAIFDAVRPMQIFFFLTSGAIRVLYLAREREILLYRVQPGETCILSVCHLLTGLHYQAIAYTEQPVTGVAIPEALCTQFLEGSPLFCSYLFRSFSGRLLDLLALLEAVSFRQLDQRLAELLLSRGITIHSTHSQLADELGSVREVISRILKEFERKGMVKLDRGKIMILDQQALQKITNYIDD